MPVSSSSICTYQLFADLFGTLGYFLRRSTQTASSTCLIIMQRSLNCFCRPALIQSTTTMRCLLDSMLVLTKQDRLCHVVHATSDPFYQTWLRQLNIMQHCKVGPFTCVLNANSDRSYRWSLSAIALKKRHGHISTRNCIIEFRNGSSPVSTLRSCMRHSEES